MLLNIAFCYGQQYVSIYEIGEPIADCDSNMKNLLANWTTDRIVNADEFEFLDWSFVETIADSARYNFYRNYYSSLEPVCKSMRRRSGVGSSGNEFDSLWVYPGYPYPQFYDTRGLPGKFKEILSEDFRTKAKNILSCEMNIDTMQFLYHTHLEIDSMEIFDAAGNVYNTKRVRTFSHNVASKDSLSQNYIDVFINRTKTYDELPIEEARELNLEELLVQRITQQISFNQHIKIGDKVFLIKFKHDEKIYANYIICSAETHKIVMDYFFCDINFEIK